MSTPEPLRPPRAALRRHPRRAFLPLIAALVVGAAGCASVLANPLEPTPAPRKQPNATPTDTATPVAPTPTPSPTPTPPRPTPTPRASPFAAPDVASLPSPPRIPPERILIPRVGIDAKIVRLDWKIDEKGANVWETAAFAVGIHRGSANPGERGNVIMSGHVSSIHEGAVFKHLPDVVVGDGIILMTAEQNYLYRVVKTVVVTPDHLDVMSQTPDETVTLITCVPDGVYTHRLVVMGKRVQPSKPGLPSAAAP